MASATNVVTQRVVCSWRAGGLLALEANEDVNPHSRVEVCTTILAIGAVSICIIEARDVCVSLSLALSHEALSELASVFSAVLHHSPVGEVAVYWPSWRLKHGEVALLIYKNA